MSRRNTVVFRTDSSDARSFQHRFEVLEHALGLSADVSIDNLIGVRIERNLSAEIGDAAVDHHLRIRADGLRRCFGRKSQSHNFRVPTSCLT